jgi:hypothetical protein
MALAALAYASFKVWLDGTLALEYTVGSTARASSRTT